MPCLSGEAHGRVGDGLVFQHNGSGQIARVQKFTRQKKTYPMVVQQSEYGESFILWRTLADELKSALALLAKKSVMSAINYWTRTFFAYRYCAKYKYTRYGWGVYGMKKEYEKYPERLM